MSRPKCPDCQIECEWYDGYNCCNDENCRDNAYPGWQCTECGDVVPGGNPYFESEATNE